MSYPSRQKKREEKVVVSQANGAIREHHRSEATQSRWFLTVAKRDSSCSQCGGSLRKKAECVFRFEPKTLLCVPCADGREIKYRPSVRWERAKGRLRKPPRKEKSPTYPPKLLLAEVVIEASCNPDCEPGMALKWRKELLKAWGVSWPLRKGWRRELAQRWSR
jgi:hypothetical protein